MPEEPKPFHESIVDALYQSTGGGLYYLGQLIKRTKIPKNHDQILEAWRSCTKHLRGEHFTDYLGVEKHLQDQKTKATATEAQAAKPERQSACAVMP